MGELDTDATASNEGRGRLRQAVSMCEAYERVPVPVYPAGQWLRRGLHPCPARLAEDGIHMSEEE